MIQKYRHPRVVSRSKSTHSYCFMDLLENYPLLVGGLTTLFVLWLIVVMVKCICPHK